MMLIKRIIHKFKCKKLLRQPINDSTIALIDNALKLFPDVINFSDGELMDDNGFYSNHLSEAWDRAEEQNITKDEHIDFMLWSIYGVLHKRCRYLFTQGIYSLNISDLGYNEIFLEYIQDCLDSDRPVYTII